MKKSQTQTHWSATSPSFLISAALAAFMLFLGVRGLLAPEAAAHGFGLGFFDPGDAVWLQIKGVRNVSVAPRPHRADADDLNGIRDGTPSFEHHPPLTRADWNAGRAIRSDGRRVIVTRCHACTLPVKTGARASPASFDSMPDWMVVRTAGKGRS
jgi:hypothetical protein